MRYAVRSAAMIEDGDNKSYAGYFTTKLNVSKNEISNAISDIISHVVKKDQNCANLFSIIIFLFRCYLMTLQVFSLIILFHSPNLLYLLTKQEMYSIMHIIII